ncbi:MAG TPA: alpha-1,2-fucosyltransferase [Candidatus Paceibacterota bacterium]|nr:alpha-1,2-fucosyltransferase [Candidatus Paceibacterota bacterium]
MAIIVKLQGGLGNQMFQYALGRSLSLKKKVPLLLDIGSFSRDPLRAYALGCFSLKAEFASPSDVERLARYQRLPDGIVSRARNALCARWDRYAREKRFHFDPDVFSVADDAYLDGYWNTEKYFKDIRPALLSDFRVAAPLAGKNAEAAQAARSAESVSVHVRRGDYAHNPQTNIVHGTLEADYYGPAIARMQEKLAAPRFFVFSDDIPWVRDNLSLPAGTIFVDWNGKEAHEDLRLMSLCKHHIIANSTFSWWGAWLSEYPGKVVIAPARWFRTQKKSTDTRDVLPESWIRI